jgi:hypothetical protein
MKAYYKICRSQKRSKYFIEIDEKPALHHQTSARIKKYEETAYKTDPALEPQQPETPSTKRQQYLKLTILPL